MLLKKSRIRLMCCFLVGALILSGCSRNEVKKAPTIPDSSQLELNGKGKTGRLRRDSRGSQYDTLWDRLFALYALPPIDHPDIDRELNWFANHPAYLERAQNRAEPFLYSIVKLVEKKNVPGEIALLPIVESAFQPHVVSSARAAGIWQFIPSTGTNYGLKRNHSYDGRRDVYASTKAAIKYLKKLHGDFGDWLLAIAAYNCGEGAVGRAIRRNQAAGLPTDFWSLNLPQETRAYVPKLLAVSRLFADAEKYGISLKDLPNVAKYKPVKVTNQLDLALAADAAGISLDKLYELNPGFKGQYADIDGSYHLYIPADKKAADFREEVERLHSQRRPLPRPAAFDEGLPTEPGAFQTFRREFQKKSSDPNSDSKDQGSSGPYASYDSAFRAKRASSGEGHVAPRDDLAENRRSSAATSETRYGRASAGDVSQRHPEGGSHKGAYEVRRGETLYEVARKHSVDVDDLAKWNHISPRTQVQAGQKLLLNDPQEEASPPHGKSRYAETDRQAKKTVHETLPAKGRQTVAHEKAPAAHQESQAKGSSKGGKATHPAVSKDRETTPHKKTEKKSHR